MARRSVTRGDAAPEKGVRCARAASRVAFAYAQAQFRPSHLVGAKLVHQHDARPFPQRGAPIIDGIQEARACSEQ